MRNDLAVMQFGKRGEVHLIYETVADDIGHTAAGTVPVGGFGNVEMMMRSISAVPVSGRLLPD